MPDDLTPDALAELRRLLDVANSELVMTASLEMDYSLMRKSTRALFIAAVEALPALLDAAAERDALTTVQPCVMEQEEPYDFAWCETHARTFALGGTCDHAGLSHVDYLDEDGRKQRGRAVRAEMELDALREELERMTAEVAQLRLLTTSLWERLVVRRKVPDLPVMQPSPWQEGLCPDCGHHLDTPNHELGCQR